ncbi:DUF1028 domain-containing protein [Hyphomicrobium sp. 2TAF46]|uniref:DUF1028 domain-containing protein n=1 Tax=Hyphomicrobium sp. 2TAF46 TaxID=3233019 RepID=UPI003F8E4B9E
MTFSIAARCAKTGMFGIALASSSPAVAARCVHVRAKVGAVTSQNITDPALGQKALALLAEGHSAPKALDLLLSDYCFAAYRQVGLIDNEGRTAVFSGEKSLGVYAEVQGKDCVCSGNLLASTRVITEMARCFEQTDGHLGDRLVAVLKAARAAGGEAGPIHAGGMSLVDAVSWPVADLRVDWHDNDPIEAISDLWRLYKPQLNDFLARALDPSSAPSYGVPGDP